MTGQQFETKVCEWLKDAGFWALNIPRSRAGQQPFDIIAIKGSCLVALDCKVMSGKGLRFPLERVEVNQWLSFKTLETKSLNTVIGIVVWKNKTSQMFFVSYKQLRQAAQRGEHSVDLTNGRLEQINLLTEIRQ